MFCSVTAACCSFVISADMVMFLQHLVVYLSVCQQKYWKKVN